MAVPYATDLDVKYHGGLAYDDVDKFVAKYPGRLAAMSLAVSAKFDTILAMRHGVPFVAPFPPELVMSVAHVLAWEMALGKGINPTTEQSKELKARHDAAWDWAERVRRNELKINGADATPSVSEGGPVARSMPSAKQVLYGYGSGGWKSGCGKC